jgi:hypothetical protein
MKFFQGDRCNATLGGARSIQLSYGGILDLLSNVLFYPITPVSVKQTSIYGLTNAQITDATPHSSFTTPVFWDSIQIPEKDSNYSFLYP